MTAHPSATADVLVIGGGPAGSAAAAQLAQRGHSVILVERDVLPRADRFGALISPRALAALRQLELGDLEPFHHVRHVRLTYAGKSTSTGWPSHPEYPAYAAVAARDVFDHRLLQAAEAEGVTVFRGHEATDPIIERGFARGADITAPDAASSRPELPTRSSPTGPTVVSVAPSVRPASRRGPTPSPIGRPTARHSMTPVRSNSSPTCATARAPRSPDTAGCCPPVTATSRSV